MTRNILLTAPPYAVEDAVKRLGANLRTARLRRNLNISDVTQKIGTGPRAIADAESGKISTSIAVYAALLWAYDLTNQLSNLADPDTDEEGKNLDSTRARTRARSRDELDNDF